MQDSTATLKTQLYDPYVKAIRWASDRIGEEGVVAFVTNNRFLDGVAFDGMRKHLAHDFDKDLHSGLGGNGNEPKASGERHNVFGIRCGVSINFFIKKANVQMVKTEIFYARLDEFWRKEDKYLSRFKEALRCIEWQPITLTGKAHMADRRAPRRI